MKYLFTAVALSLTFAVAAQTSLPDSVAMANANTQGNTMAQLLLEKNYTDFAKYTYPPIIKMAGGEKNMIAIIKKGLDDVEAQGYTFISFSIEKPTKILHLKNSLQCVVVENIKMKIPNGKLTTSSALIGVSTDKGNNWTFIDTHGADLKSLQKTIPGLSNDLQMPEKKEPIITKD